MKKLIVLLSVFSMMIPNMVFAEENESVTSEKEEIVTLEKCVDGDTAKFRSADGSITTYRFLAIDTPETVHPTKGVEPFGKEASDYTCNALTNAEEILLEFDDKAQEKDKYDRGLAWIFVDGELLQEQLVSLGYAEVAYLYDDYKYTTLLQDIEAVAKTNKVGIWSETEETVETEATEEVTESETETEENFITAFLNQLMDAITASLNKFVDSILQMIEDML